MIQRVQSLYLLLAIGCMAALFTLGYPFESDAAETLPWFEAGLSLLAGATVGAAALAVFQYRRRETQVRTVRIAAALALLVLAVQAVGYALAGDFNRIAGEGLVVGYVALALPLVAALLLLLAGRAVARDIALVRSMDRLR